MSTSAREQGEAEARRLIAIIDGSHPSRRERYRDLKAEAGRSGILASKCLLDGVTDAAIEQAAAASLLADAASAAAQELRQASGHAAQARAAMSTAALTPSGHEAPRLVL